MLGLHMLDLHIIKGGGINELLVLISFASFVLLRSQSRNSSTSFFQWLVIVPVTCWIQRDVFVNITVTTTTLVINIGAIIFVLIAWSSNMTWRLQTFYHCLCNQFNQFGSRTENWNYCSYYYYCCCYHYNYQCFHNYFRYCLCWFCSCCCYYWKQHDGQKEVWLQLMMNYSFRW